MLNLLSVQFKLPRFLVYQAICDVLEKDSRITNAVECFRRMQSELASDKSMHDERAQWEFGRWLREQYSQRSTEHSAQSSKDDAQRG